MNSCKSDFNILFVIQINIINKIGSILLMETVKITVCLLYHILNAKANQDLGSTACISAQSRLCLSSSVCNLVSCVGDGSDLLQ